MSQIEQGQQVAQLPQQGLEQLGLLVACSDYTEPPKTALVNCATAWTFVLPPPV